MTGPIWHTPAVFAVMRALGAEADRHLVQSQHLAPRYGEVAVGGAHMDDFFHDRKEVLTISAADRDCEAARREDASSRSGD